METNWEGDAGQKFKDNYDAIKADVIKYRDYLTGEFKTELDAMAQTAESAESDVKSLG